jgi:hypothetical protein
MLFKNFPEKSGNMVAVGHDVFDVKHYWLRYEFAPSRGQIHAHLLAICSDHSFNVAMHRLKGNKEA